MMTDITYRVEGDYLIPNLIMDGETDDSSEEMIGRYGVLREHFLKEYQHGTYTTMLLMRSLTTHLQEIDRQAEEEVEYLLRKMMERQGVDETLKALDQMTWVRKVNVLGRWRRKWYCGRLCISKAVCDRQNIYSLKNMNHKNSGVRIWWFQTFLNGI